MEGLVMLEQPIKSTAKAQWRNKAPAGVVSGIFWASPWPRASRFSLAYGVVTDLANKREYGRMPSAAISCLTVPIARYKSVCSGDKPSRTPQQQGV